MYLKSPYPDPPPLPAVNAHHIFFKRPDQADWPDYTLHIDAVTGKRVMYRDWVRDVEDLSTAFAGPSSQGCMGLQGWNEGEGAEVVVPGGKEIIGIMSENSSEYIALIHACIRVAVPFALVSSYSTPFELKHSLKLSKATRLFVDAKFLKTVLPVAREVGLSEDKIYLMKETGASRKLKTFKGLIQDVRKRKVPLVDIRPAGKDTLAYLVFSSGTSGLPKAVMISHGNLIFSVGQSLVMVQVISEVYTPPTPGTPEGIPITLAFLPLHHTYGLHAYSFRACLAPSTLVILPKWDINVALKVIPRYHVTSLTLIPSVVHQLVNHPGIEKADFSSVLSMNSGAAYLPPELGEKMSSLMPKETIFSEGYGMSEATIAAITQPYAGTLGGKLNPISGCTGILLPGMEALTFKDETGVPPVNFTLPNAVPGAPTPSGLPGECALNEPGELWVRSGNVALGYWNNPKANAETFIRGWLRSGDRFRIDEGGNFWFADRAKVSPVEIADCLLAHPERLITDATVAGVSGGRTSDEKVPRAWIVLSTTGKDKKTWGKAKVVKELERWHQENLSKYKWLRGGIEIVDEGSIPKSPTGKTLRRVLVDKYEAKLKKGQERAKL
ncbi:hypothetical protein M413DRAFT_19093 [Hebeloma cylindrosporum]|uniref:AMP-dependent synthetase/ligase domain-containing protein n=1 Tax=Hebeloma cylindrosporum TaxID=76867 RepID=A0A0C3CBL4_HEBCY|nr:hypothetical protein M413DRAFT_19093 [Hebeloma cylindrosporum h7]